MAVVLPAPLGPSTPSTSPRRTSRSSPSSATTGPYRCVTRERLARVWSCAGPACMGGTYGAVARGVSGSTLGGPLNTRAPRSVASGPLPQRLAAPEGLCSRGRPEELQVKYRQRSPDAQRRLDSLSRLRRDPSLKMTPSPPGGDPPALATINSVTLRACRAATSFPPPATATPSSSLANDPKPQKRSFGRTVERLRITRGHRRDRLRRQVPVESGAL